MPDKKKKRLLSQHSINVMVAEAERQRQAGGTTYPRGGALVPTDTLTKGPQLGPVTAPITPSMPGFLQLPTGGLPTPSGLPSAPRTSSYGGPLLEPLSNPATGELANQPGPQVPQSTGYSYKPPGDVKGPGRSFSDTEYENLTSLVYGAAANGLPFPTGAERWTTNNLAKPGEDPIWTTVLSPESARLYSIYKDAVALKLQGEETSRLKQESQQTFLQTLLQKPGALAAFMLLGGRGLGGGFGLPQGQLPQDPYGTNQKFGFQPYQNPTATTSGYQSADTGTALTPEQLGLIRRSNSGQGFDQLESTGAITRQTQPIGAPIGNFFMGGVPNLGQLGTNPDARDALIGMLAAFDIDPSMLYQASAKATPRSVRGTGGGGRISLAAGRR